MGITIISINRTQHPPPLGEFNTNNPPARVRTVKKWHASQFKPPSVQMNGNNGLVNYKYMQAGQSVSQMDDAQIKTSMQSR